LVWPPRKLLAKRVSFDEQSIAEEEIPLFLELRALGLMLHTCTWPPTPLGPFCVVDATTHRLLLDKQPKPVIALGGASHLIRSTSAPEVRHHARIVALDKEAMRRPLC
jgi:hypothetical protein